METVTVPNSVYIEGQWFAAHWAAEVVDDDSGELVLTATVDGSAPRVTALKLEMETVGALRRAAGFDGPLPSQRADAAEADLRYWRESVEFAVRMLERGRQGGSVRREAENAESYLRQLLEMQAATDEADCYDCSTNAQRMADLEARVKGLTTALGACAASATVDAQGKRLSALGDEIATVRATGHGFHRLEARIDALVEQVRAETQGNIAAFANIDQAINDHERMKERITILEEALTRRVEALESVNSPWPLLNETAVNLETLRQTVEFCNSRLEALEAWQEVVRQRAAGKSSDNNSLSGGPGWA